LGKISGVRTGQKSWQNEKGRGIRPELTFENDKGGARNSRGENKEREGTRAAHVAGKYKIFPQGIGEKIQTHRGEKLTQSKTENLGRCHRRSVWKGGKMVASI